MFLNRVPEENVCTIFNEYIIPIPLAKTTFILKGSGTRHFCVMRMCSALQCSEYCSVYDNYLKNGGRRDVSFTVHDYAILLFLDL